MASTYTDSTGIELIGSGEQAGTWGNTSNNNFKIIDRALNGAVTLTISGNTNLTTSDGTLSDGQHKVIILSGTPSGAFTLTITPNDQTKQYFIKNSSGQTATITQGSGASVTLLNGLSDIVLADGAGSGAAVTSLLNATDLVADTSPQLGGTLDTNGQAIQFGSSKWTILLDTGDNDLLFKYNGTTVFKLASNGAATSANNITAFGSP
tara:strand:+ start:143 stop:766 length:624 start_codon:yes stop_codon:yes gene_type:complete